MKICCLADAIDIHTRKWVNFFARKGHEVHLISPSPGEGYVDSIQFYQLDVPLPQKFWTPLRAINVLTRIMKVRRLVRKIKPDIVSAHYITTNGVLGAASGFHPLVLTAWGSDIITLPKSNFYWLRLGRYALKKADVVTCDSEVLRRGLVGFGVDPDDIRLIYHGVDTQVFRPRPNGEPRANLGLHEVPVVISTRKLSAVYNVEMFIRAIPLILEQVPQAGFIIAGDGELKGELENLAASLGIAASVRFTGWVTAEEISEYLSASDVYVSTSLSDSTSLSLQEAMACELATVVTTVPANQEWVVEGETGFIVPMDDVAALADKVVYLLKNMEISNKFGKKGRSIIVERADYEKEMDKMVALFEEILKTWQTSGKAV